MSREVRKRALVVIDSFNFYCSDKQLLATAYGLKNSLTTCISSGTLPLRIYKFNMPKIPLAVEGNLITVYKHTPFLYMGRHSDTVRLWYPLPRACLDPALSAWDRDLERLQEGVQRRWRRSIDVRVSWQVQ